MIRDKDTLLSSIKPNVSMIARVDVALEILIDLRDVCIAFIKDTSFITTVLKEELAREIEEDKKKKK